MKFLKHLHIEDCKPIGMALQPKTKLKNMNEDDEMIEVPYPKAMGSLMYAMLCTQLNLAYLINVLIQHIANLSMKH
jgi:hypothetical protein